MPQPKTARGDLSKGNSGSSKKSRSNGSAPEELHGLSIAKVGCTTSIYHLGCGQAQLIALFYCFDYVTKPPCETQVAFSHLSDDEGGIPPPLEPMRGRTAPAAHTSASATTERQA
jgi:hypothetical protein